MKSPGQLAVNLIKLTLLEIYKKMVYSKLIKIHKTVPEYALIISFPTLASACRNFIGKLTETRKY